MTRTLKRQGWKINHKRVERVMKQAGLICRHKPRFGHTTDSKHSEPVYSNLIKELSIEALNQCWVADLTYVRLPEGFVHLADVLDACSHKCRSVFLIDKKNTKNAAFCLEVQEISCTARSA